MIDRTIRATSRRESELLAEIHRRGLTLQRVRHGSPAVRLLGHGVDVMASELRRLAPEDLKPATGRERGRG